MKIAILSTSHDVLGETGLPTGLGLETFACPYYRFLDAGAEVTLASIRGGRPPIDPLSVGEETSTEETTRFEADHRAQAAFNQTIAITDLPDLDALFIAGGHGGMWDFPDYAPLQRYLRAMLNANRPIAAICHAPAAFCGLPAASLKGRKITGLSNSEETYMERATVVPFLLETRLLDMGALYEKGADFTSYVVQDGPLITGQNMRSAEAAATALLDVLKT